MKGFTKLQYSSGLKKHYIMNNDLLPPFTFLYLENFLFSDFFLAQGNINALFQNSGENSIL